MRKITVWALVITGAALLAIIIPAVTTGQPGGGGFGKGGKGGGKGGGGINSSQDPDALFDWLSQGKSYITVDDTKRSRAINGPFSVYAQENGLMNAQITRSQFREFFNYINAKAGVAPAPTTPAPGMNPGGFGGGFGGGGPGGFKKKGGGDGPPANFDPTALYPFADAEFKKQDANQDGKLVPEEMPRSLRANLEKWDKNGDGFIDIFEYRAYYVAKMQGSEDAGFGGKKGIDAIIIDEEDLDRKPVVFRAGPGGKQPPGLPDWFNKFDTDKDGQVALYEWRMAGKSLDEFQAWDLNDDGFITAEEAAKVQLTKAKDNPSRGSLASAGDGSAGDRPSMGMGKQKGPGSFQFPSGGENPFKGKGKGGDKRKGDKGSN